MLVRTDNQGLGRADYNPDFPARRFAGRRPRRTPLYECAGLGQSEKPAVIEHPVIAEPAKLLGYFVAGYFILKGVGSTAKRTVQ